MSQIYLSPRPRPVDIAVSPVPGAVRQTSVLCYRSVGLAPASRKRLHFPCSPGNYIAQNDARDIINPAASYTPREEASAEAQARRVDDEHGATQLILLLALSVVLLTLPWIVDHPVTLLVPVALFILPITSDALRSLALEGFALVSGGIRWFWRHRKAGHSHAAVQQGEACLGKPRLAVPLGYTQHAKAYNAWKPRAASVYVTSQQPELWQSSASSSPHSGIRYTVVDPSTVASGVQQSGTTQGSSAHEGSVSKQLEWQSTPQCTRSMVHPVLAVMPQSATVLPELITPDLDFDSDSETAAGQDTPVRPSYVSRSYRQEHYDAGQTHSPQAHSVKHCSLQHVTGHRLSSTTRPAEQAECTVYNWDEADECTHRRGHRPLSDLLSNVQ